MAKGEGEISTNGQRACCNSGEDGAVSGEFDLLRATMNAPTTTASESASIEPSRKSVFTPRCSPGPKQPQLISSPMAYVRTIVTKNPPSSRVDAREERRSAI